MANVIWTPQPRQAALMARFEDEALYGGAAGGGKSDCALAEALRQVEISSSETVRATTDGRSPSPARPRPRSSTICWRPPVCWRSCRT